jgi:hypothetical protein
VRKKSKLAIAVISAAVLASALATGAQAAIFVANTSAASGTLNTPGPTNVQNEKSAAPTSAASSSLTDQSFDQAAKASSSSSAVAEIGAVHASSVALADAFALGCCTTGLSGASALAEYNDVLFLHSATIADGTVGQLTANILVNGGAGGSTSGQFWSGNVSWRATTALNGESFVDSYFSSGDGTNGFTSTGSNNFGLRSFTFDVVFGAASNVILRVETGASASAGGFGANSAQFSSDLSHTVSWQGISGLTVGGVAVTDFTAVSTDTGFDFARGFNPPADTGGGVPEPSAWALLLVGFAGVGGMIRRRRPAIA